ncbi:MAG: type II toxin-antitoxin system Phd/YefM family antitoxin [Deltaproteobacteria bacterium]|jgi:prevent-host-death family protein|nr:type II toxin-antitoxin system Phd/YefM family antitoxin [Deltaproteobacteria bacterium]
MKILSLSEAKMKLSGLVEEVKNSDEEILITKNGSPAAVLISPGEFENWKETVTIRSDSSLMEEIRKGLEALKEKKARLYTLEALCE